MAVTAPSRGTDDKVAGEARAREVRKSDDVIALCVTGGERNRASWYLDSCASDHMCSDISKFQSFRASKGQTVRLGDGNIAAVEGIWEVEIALAESSGGRKINLSEVLYVPLLQGNLLSVGKLTCKGVSVNFDESAEIAKLGGEEIFIAQKRDGVYVVDVLADEHQVDPIFRVPSLRRGTT